MTLKMKHYWCLWQEKCMKKKEMQHRDKLFIFTDLSQSFPCFLNILPVNMLQNMPFIRSVRGSSLGKWMWRISKTLWKAEIVIILQKNDIQISKNCLFPVYQRYNKPQCVRQVYYEVKENLKKGAGIVEPF